MKNALQLLRLRGVFWNIKPLGTSEQCQRVQAAYDAHVACLIYYYSNIVLIN